MRFTPLEISGAFIVDLEPISDTRGSFARSFCAREFAAQGLASTFPQHSRSQNAVKGTLRGMHWQAAPNEEAKLVGCVRGAIYDVCLDLRRGSPTYLQWYGAELSADNRRQFYIPQGCAHGFQTLTDDAEVNYLISAEYAPESARGARYNDPAFGINWPLPVSAISDKDRDCPDYTP